MNPPDNPPASVQPQSGGIPTLLSLSELEQIWQRQVGVFLQDMKQTTLKLVEDVSAKYGESALARVRQTLTDTMAAVFKSQEAALWAQLKPALSEGTEAMRQKADAMMANLKQVIAVTVGEVFRVHVPEYSRWAGQRVLDYFLAGTLFCLAVVLVGVGTVHGLLHVGLPPFVTYLVTGTGALVLGLVFLRVRARRWSATVSETGPPG